MNLKQLSYFVKIAQVGSFSAAGRGLYVAQPALTHHISALEEELGVALFIRSVKGVSLTHAGEKFLHHAERVLYQIEVAKADAVSDEVTPRGELRLVLDSSKSYTLIPPLILACEERYPEIHLNIIDAMSVNAAQMIADGKVDMGIIPNGADLRGVTVIPVLQEFLYLVGKSIHSSQYSDQVPFSALGDFPLVMPSRPHNLRMLMEQKALEANRPLNIRYEQDSGASLRSMVSSGIANGIVPHSVASHEWEKDGLEVLKIVSPEVERTHAIVMLENRPVTSAGLAIQSLLQEIIKNLNQTGRLCGKLLL